MPCSTCGANAVHCRCVFGYNSGPPRQSAGAVTGPSPATYTVPEGWRCERCSQDALFCGCPPAARRSVRERAVNAAVARHRSLAMWRCIVCKGDSRICGHGPRDAENLRDLAERLTAYALSVVVWWVEAGRVFYGRGAAIGHVDAMGGYHQYDEGLRGLVVDAVVVLGGWRRARALLRGMGEVERQRHAAQAVRGIRVRGEG